MKLQELYEAKIGAKVVSAAMKSIVAYLERKLNAKLIKIPGIEHYTNSTEEGYGLRYVFGGGKQSIRFNWQTASTGNASQMMSITYWNGTSHDPSFTLKPNGVSFAQVLPSLVKWLLNPKGGNITVFPASTKEENEAAIAEAKRGDYSAEQALTDVLKEIGAGKSMTRSEFIGRYHISNVGVFDTLFGNFAEHFDVKGKRLTKKDGVNYDAVKKQVLSVAGAIEVVSGGKHETYAATKAEEEIEERVPFTKTLEHLEGLVHGIISGAFNALFVAGKGGSLSGSTPINVIIKDTAEIIDARDKTENSI